MDTIERILKTADFSKESNFKERLLTKLNMRAAIEDLNDGEIEDEEQLLNIVAASGRQSLPVNPVKLLED